MTSKEQKPRFARCLGTWGLRRAGVCERGLCPHYAQAEQVEKAVLRGSVSDPKALGDHFRDRVDELIPFCDPSNL